MSAEGPVTGAIERDLGLGPARGSSHWASVRRRVLRKRSAVLAAVILVALVVASVLVPELSTFRYDRADLALGPTPPSLTHLFGTDLHGRDLCARVFFGGRVSLGVALVSTIVSLVIGVTWGGVAGYVGGKVDAILMRVIDVLYSVPSLLYVILLMVFFTGERSAPFRAFRAVLGAFVARPEDPAYAAVFPLVVVFIAIGACSWLTMARIVRGQVLAIKGQPFVEAARALGARGSSILVRHILPNAISPVILYTALMIPEVMMAEAFLSFLGLGTQEPLSSLGLLAATGADVMDLYPWLIAFPAGMLALLFLCFTWLGDALRDALDPSLGNHPR